MEFANERERLKKEVGPAFDGEEVRKESCFVKPKGSETLPDLRNAMDSSTNDAGLVGLFGRGCFKSHGYIFFGVLSGSPSPSHAMLFF